MKFSQLFVIVSVLSISSCTHEISQDKQAADTFVQLAPGDSVPIRTYTTRDEPEPKVLRVYESLNFGNGYNSSTGEEYFGVLDYESADTSAEVAGAARGNRGEITIEKVANLEELKTSLNISAAAELDFSLGAWSSQNSLKLSTLRTTEFNGFSEQLIIKAHYANEPLVLKNPKVREELVKLAKEDPEAFMRSCGDMFVSRIYTGGELYSLYSMNSRNSRESEKNNLFFETTNQYLGANINAKVTAESVNTSFNKVENINTKIITQGGGATPKSLTVAGFLEYASNFKEDVSADKRAIILYVELSPYENIAGFPDIDFSKIRVTQRGVLTNTGRLLTEVDISEGNAQFALENPKLFSEGDVERAKEVLEESQDYRGMLRYILANCKADPDACHLDDLVVFEDFHVFDPEYKLPEWQGIRTKMPLKPSGEWTSVCEDTEDGFVLSIQGDMEIRKNTSSAPVCRAPTYAAKEDLTFYKNVNLWTFEWWVPFLSETSFYERFRYPYYQVQYVSLETGKELKRFAYRAPLNTEKNVQVNVRLINPVKELVYRNRNGKYVKAGKAFEKAFKFKKTPMYPIIQSCDRALPVTAVIAPIPNDSDTTAGNLMMSSSSKDDPEIMIEGGVYSFEKPWDNEE